MSYEGHESHEARLVLLRPLGGGLSHANGQWYSTHCSRMSTREVQPSVFAGRVEVPPADDEHDHQHRLFEQESSSAIGACEGAWDGDFIN